MEVFGVALPGWAVSLLAIAVLAVVGSTAYAWWQRAQRETRARFYESLGPKRKIELSDRPPALASKPRQPQQYVSPRRNDLLVNQARFPPQPAWNTGFQPHLSELSRRAPIVHEPSRSGPLENSEPSSIASGYGESTRIPHSLQSRYSPQRSQPNFERNDSYISLPPAAYQRTPRLRPDYIDNIPAALFETPNVDVKDDLAEQSMSTSHAFEPLGPRPSFEDNMNVSYQPVPPSSRKRILFDENTEDRDEGRRIMETVEETSSPMPKRRRRLAENNEDVEMEIVTTEESLGTSSSGRRVIKRIIKRKVKKPSSTPQQSRSTSNRQADPHGSGFTPGAVTPQTGKRKAADRYSYDYEENEREADVDESDMPAGDGWITRSALKSGKRLRTGKANGDEGESDAPSSSKSSRKRASDSSSSSNSSSKKGPHGLDDDDSEHENEDEKVSSTLRSPPNLQAISTAKGRVKVSQTPKKDSSLAKGPIDMLKPPMTSNDADETIRKLISTPSKTPSTEKKSVRFASDDGMPNEVKLFNASSPPDSAGRTKGIKFNAEEPVSPLAPASMPSVELHSISNEKGKEPAKLNFTLPTASPEATDSTKPKPTASPSDETTKISPVAAFGTPTPAAPASLKFDFFKAGKLPELSSTPGATIGKMDDSASVPAPSTSTPVGFGTNPVVAFSFGGPSADSGSSAISNPSVPETTEVKPTIAAPNTTAEAKPTFPAFTFGGTAASGLSFGLKPSDISTEKSSAPAATEAPMLSFSLPTLSTAVIAASASTTVTSATSTAPAPAFNFSAGAGFGSSGSSAVSTSAATTSTAPAAAPAFTFGASATGGLNFGASTAPAPSAARPSSLSFAAPAASTTTPSFGFAAPATGTSGQPATSGFSFGGATGIVTSTPAALSLLGQARGAPAGFGTPTPVATAAASSNVPSFGQPVTSTVSGGFGSTAPRTAPAFSFPGIQPTSGQAALSSFSFGASGTGGSQGSSTTGFNFAGGATTSAPVPSGSTSSFSFGASAPPASQPASGTPSMPFTFGQSGAPSSFGAPSSQASFGGAPSSSGFSFGQTSATLATSAGPAFNALATSQPSFTAPSLGAPTTGFQSSFSAPGTGSAPPTSQQGFSFGTSSFGAGQPQQQQQPQQSGFSFGNTSGAPAFQQPQQQAAPAFAAGGASGSTGFQFGAQVAGAAGVAAPFKFGGAPVAGGGSTGFSFGQSNPPGSSAGAAAPGPFSFSSGSSVSGGSGAFAPPSASGGESAKLGRKILPQPKARKRLPMPPR
ncbi:hypothetical protein BJ742DRAFT_413713 [Cladochytrium replicatum]|nr:hypothetical protein BJ742DRAFT_413713 [Cladochytrium replicatum]